MRCSMKLVSYRMKNQQEPLRVGVMIDDSVVDAQEAYRRFRSLDGGEAIESLVPHDPTSFFRLGNPAVERVQEAYTYWIGKHFDGVDILSRDSLYLGTLIPEPSKIICVGKNYVEHAVEMKSDVPDFPVLFAKFANALIGPDDAINKTRLTTKLDYEVELTVVIGQEASKIKREEAFAYIAGYTIGNDISARDLQKRTPQWLQGKTIDRSTPIGPWLVTPDEVGDPGRLAIRCLVNGEERQASNTEKLIFDIPFLIEFISNVITLKPGDLIMTGTPDGVAFGMESPKFLQNGDVVTVEIENIGRMENRVVEED
jgi:acylpyruvate hydrolase